MSAKNRGGLSKPHDFYPTPESSTRNFLSKHILHTNRYDVLEPCAGNGSISKIVKELYPMIDLDQIEIREEERKNLQQYGNVFIEDFLTFVPTKSYDVIITNPPFSLAQEFLEKCFEIADENTEIIMLLRLAFLESQKRHKFWQKYPVNQLYILSERPSFTGKGTDATAYAWFVWNNKAKNINVI